MARAECVCESARRVEYKLDDCVRAKEFCLREYNIWRACVCLEIYSKIYLLQLESYIHILLKWGWLEIFRDERLKAIYAGSEQ